MYIAQCIDTWLQGWVRGGEARVGQGGYRGHAQCVWVKAAAGGGTLAAVIMAWRKSLVRAGGCNRRAPNCCALTWCFGGTGSFAVCAAFCTVALRCCVAIEKH